jgi:hypothetical protein
MTKWGSFLKSPPPLYHYPQFPQHAAGADFWFPLAILFSGVVSVVTLVFLPWKKQRELKAILVIPILVAALVTVALAICYEWQRSIWTFDYHGELVLIGDTYTAAGKADPRDSRDDWFGDFGENSREVWVDDGLFRSYLRLGLLYLSAGLAAGVTFALAGWFGSQIASRLGPA